jgi:hypothetical protein
MAKINSGIWRSRLDAHQRIGKELISPFNKSPISPTQIFWWRDMLPEFLWLDSLVHTYGEPMAVGVFAEFMGTADRFNPHNEEILDGTVSAFSLVPEDRRPAFCQELSAQLKAAVLMPFGDVMSLYPQCPMSWIAEGVPAGEERESCVVKAREAVLRLMPGKSNHPGLCRTLPLHRLLAHQRVFILDTLTDLIEALRLYPNGDRRRVESYARQLHQSLWIQRLEKEPQLLNWSRYYWRTNLSIAQCKL